MNRPDQALADALRSLSNRYVLANPPDHAGPEMRAARDALAKHAAAAAAEPSAVAVLDRLLQLSKSEAWNGSFKLDEALDDARAIVEAARGDADPRLTASTPDDQTFQRILVLSDGTTWETFDPARIRVLDVSQDAFDDLCEGSEPDDLQGDQILRDASLAALAFGNRAALAPQALLIDHLAGALRSAVGALNIKPRFSVPAQETDSYAIASRSEAVLRECSSVLEGRISPADAEERQRLTEFLVKDWFYGIGSGVKGQHEVDAFLRTGHVGFDRMPIEGLRRIADERGYGLDDDDDEEQERPRP